MRYRAKPVGVVALTGAAALLAIGACDGSDEEGARGSTGPAAREPIATEAVDIAYTRYMPNGFGDIFVMSADGSDKGRLTRTREISEGFLAWSPDGTRIAYSSQVGTFTEIWVMSIAGNEQRNLTETPRVVEDDPAWSPDGEQIAFTVGRNNMDLFVISLDGGERSNLTKSPNRSEASPVFSPDGKRIMFSRSNGIFVINTDGTGQRKLSQRLGATVGFPTFSPDGERIVFLGRFPGAETARVWMMNADGSDAAPLAQGPRIETSSGPEFSPDGRKIAYVGANPRRRGIYVMKADGTRRVRLTRHVSDVKPVWRPVAGR